MAGTVKKSSNYRKMILGNVVALENHPIHGGIKMQAHHLISADAVQRSGIGKWLVDMDYNINLLPNLVLLPCTLQGACHLGVQPHRGNHDTPSDGDDNDNDGMHPDSYHKIIRNRLRLLKELQQEKLCSATDQNAYAKLSKKMAVLSTSILKMIQYTPNMMRLTTVADYYTPGRAGCGGMDNIPPKLSSDFIFKYTKTHVCAVHRNHYKAQASTQTAENIVYNKPENIYKLHAGR